MALAIDADGEAVPFRPDPWQQADFEALDDAWLQVAGFEVDDKPIRRRAWQERPRGHSKTSDIAIMATWALVYSRRPIRGIGAAASKDQAGLLRDAIQTLARLNPAIGEALEIQNWAVVNRVTGSTLEIMSSDVPTSYGQLPDFIVCDEVSHWPEGRGEDLWGSLFSSAAKRARRLLMVITNAGFMESWVWHVRGKVLGDPGWHFSHLYDCQASWITPDRATSEEEFQSMLRGSTALFRRFLLFLRLTGCRPAEARFLRWEWIDWDLGAALIPWQFHKTGKKSHKPRILVLTIGAQKLLRWLKARDRFTQNVHVFRNSRAKPWTRTALAQRLRVIRLAAGLPLTATFHGIRHLFGSLGVTRAGNLKMTSKILGHGQSAITERYYVHIDQRDVDAMREVANSAAHRSFNNGREGGTK